MSLDDGVVTNFMRTVQLSQRCFKHHLIRAGFEMKAVLQSSYMPSQISIFWCIGADIPSYSENISFMYVYIRTTLQVFTLCLPMFASASCIFICALSLHVRTINVPRKRWIQKNSVRIMFLAVQNLWSRFRFWENHRNSTQILYKTWRNDQTDKGSLFNDSNI